MPDHTTSKRTNVAVMGTLAGGTRPLVLPHLRKDLQARGASPCSIRWFKDLASIHYGVVKTIASDRYQQF